MTILPCRFLVSIALLGMSQAVAAAVTAQLEPTQVGAGEAVQLILRHDGHTGSQPDLGPLKQDFDVLGSSTGSSLQIVNGSMSAHTEIDLTLMPKRSGTLQVPPLQWDGQITPALTLTVSGNAAAAQPGSIPASGTQHVFLTTTLDQKQPYVQAAVTLTVRLYTDEPLYQASLELQPSNAVLVQQLGQDSQTSATRNGRSYRMIERKYLLFPQRSGRLRLDGPVLNAEVEDARGGNDPFGANAFFGSVFGRNPFGGMMGATRPLRVRADPLVLDVRPRPASGTGHDWLPAQKVTLAETWQPDSGPIHVGDPVTRHLHLEALGLTASQLPDLSVLMPLPDGLRAYPDQAKLNTGVQGDGVVGTRDQDIALIASRSGRYRIPPLHLSWWDTRRNLQREVDLPARTLTVLPGSGGVAASTAPPSQAAGTPLPPAESAGRASGRPAAPESPLWRWLSLGLGMLWLGTLAAWWASRRRRAPASAKPVPAAAANAPSAAGARKAFREACYANDPRAARRTLLDWARATWPHDPPLGLQALADRLGAAGPEPLLKELDRVCYAGGAWQGKALADALASLAEDGKNRSRPAPALAGLYP
ncbi:MAG: BatD family protein [Betaproteobacteria bacterium]|nr:BatD family protein [Betaproteobacteria bacterium]